MTKSFGYPNIQFSNPKRLQKIAENESFLKGATLNVNLETSEAKGNKRARACVVLILKKKESLCYF